MLDLYHIPIPTRAIIERFTGTDGSGPCARTWRKPRGVTMVHIFGVGAGAPGQAGQTRASGVNGTGGGAGGSGSQMSLLVGAHLLPDVLYVYAASPLGGGLDSWVSIAPSTSGVARNIVWYGSAGSAGSPGGSGGAGGGGGSANTISSINFAGLGFFRSIAGQNGGAGGVAATGTDITAATTGLLVTGGAGGAGVALTVPKSGGGFTPAANSFVSNFAPAAAGAGGGQPGSNIWTPFYGYGGAGGDSTDIGTGTAGGDGAYGCGGGGGGAGTTGGNGGKGGPALIIIASW